MQVQGAYEVPGLVHHEELIDKRLFEDSGSGRSHCVRLNRARGFGHDFSNRNGTDVAALFNEASEIAFGEDPGNDVISVHNRRHADVFLRDFSHGIQNADIFLDAGDRVARTHDVAHMREKPSA